MKPIALALLLRLHWRLCSMTPASISLLKNGRVLTYPQYAITTQGGLNAASFFSSTAWIYTVQNFALPFSALALEIPPAAATVETTQLAFFGFLSLYALSTGSPFYSSAQLHMLGNLNGTNEFKVDGELVNSILPNGVDVSLKTGVISKIEIPVAMQATANLADLVTTPVFTASPASTGWSFKGSIQYVVKQAFTA